MRYGYLLLLVAGCGAREETDVERANCAAVVDKTAPPDVTPVVTDRNVYDWLTAKYGHKLAQNERAEIALRLASFMDEERENSSRVLEQEQEGPFTTDPAKMAWLSEHPAGAVFVGQRCLKLSVVAKIAQRRSFTNYRPSHESGGSAVF